MTTYCVDNKNLKENCATNQPRILYIDPWHTRIPSGVVINTMYHAKTFVDHGDFFMLMYRETSIHEKYCKQFKVPYAIIPYESDLQSLKDKLITMCKHHRINIVITLRWQDITMLKEIASQVPIKIIMDRMGVLKDDDIVFNLDELKELDGFVGPPVVAQGIKRFNGINNLNIKNVRAITHFWDIDQCLNFSTDESKKAYFKRRFNIKVNDNPIMCTVANMFFPCKNHALLFKAMHQLIHEQNQKVHLMLAGDGYLRQSLEQLVKDLNIQDYVHFLGSINDVPALLHHSDMHVLPSYYDNFPLANLEAAAMKKPIIMAADIDGSVFIKNRKTGLLFANNDVNDLAHKIEYLLSSPKIRNELGQNAYEHVRQNYSNDAVYKQWQELLGDVLAE
jgi:glycosyltransferase involved in cell wall biosynthesis